MLSKAAVTLSDLLEPKTKLGMTAADLARKLGVTPQAVSGWLKGRATPTPETLRELEDIAGIPMRDWTEGAEAPPDPVPAKTGTDEN
jgi:transcriptional regulator with XRE-family HTH domain